MNEKILTTSDIDFIVKIGDDAVKASGIIEMFDGVVFRMLANLINNLVSNKVPEPLKIYIRELIAEARDKDMEGAAQVLGRFLNEKIDIPGIDENTETLLFVDGFSTLVRTIQMSIPKAA